MNAEVDSTVVMLSLGAIAERDGISKQAVSKAVNALVDKHGLPVQRDNRGRISGVSVAHYDHYRGHFGNGAMSQAPRVEPTDEGGGGGGANSRGGPNSRDEALRQQAWIDLHRKKIAQAEEDGKLVRADILATALTVAGKTIQGEVNRLANRADDLALAVSKEGTSGARMVLRKIAAELNERIANALSQVAEQAPENDETVEDIEA